MISNYAVIFGGGVGVRASSNGIPKQFLKVKGVPIIIRTLRKFEACESISKIVLVCVRGYESHIRGLIQHYGIRKVVTVVTGGATGQESIYNGLKAIQQLEWEDDSIVVIHDAVRPMISTSLITECIKSAEVFGNGIASVVCHETVAKASAGLVDELLKRDELVCLKAPQAFLYKDIWKCHEDAKAREINTYTDSASMAKSYGHELHLVSSNTSNIKITYPEDVYILKALLEAEESMSIIGLMDELNIQ